MPRGLQVVSGFVAAPGTTLTAWGMGAGDSLAVRNGLEGSEIRLLNMWADNQAAGYLRVRSALLHDNVVGINANVMAAEVLPLMPMGKGQILKPQDNLIVTQSGSNTSGDIESGSLLIYYENLPGAQANLKHYSEIVQRIESYMLVTNTIASGTAGGYSGSQVITTTDDQWKANRDYALLGYVNGVECCTIGWMGPDTSNLRVGGPGTAKYRNVTNSWFVDLSMTTGLPLIPVFNAANKAATVIDCVQDENDANPIVTSIFALLKG